MKTRAIIIKKQAINEYDQLVSCYTRGFGKVTAVAKSVMKPGSIQAMHLDIFNLVDFELVSGRGIPIITGAQADDSFKNLKSSLPHLATGYFFAEIIDRVAFEYQKDDELWDFMVSSLNELNNKPELKNFLKNKQLELLDILGYAPNLEDCVFCGRVSQASTVAYNTQAKGVVCKDCFLNGKEGIVVKNNDFFSGYMLGNIFESLAERKLHSLNFIDFMIKSNI